MTNLIVKTRFAPSPTGFIHLGNVRTALFSAVYAKAMQGVFLLRIEDTDEARSEKRYTEALMKDLKWLGLEWQEGPYYQSERSAIYESYYQQLIAKDLAYPCYCSEQALTLSRKRQQALGKAPRYAGTCAHLSKAECEAREAKGLKPSLRFRVPNETLHFVDGVQGPKTFQGTDIGDFIIRRSDGGASFMFSNAVDDALMGVTHVFRGEDHLTNTPRQLWILEAVGLTKPHYLHLPMIVGNDGKPLSKRNGSDAIQDLKEQGYFPMAIVNNLARLGHAYDTPTQIPYKSIKELAKHFKVSCIGRSPASFNKEQLQFWQKAVLSTGTEKEVWAWMQVVHALVPEDCRALFIKTVIPNIVFPEEALFWAKRFYSEAEEALSVDKGLLVDASFCKGVVAALDQTQDYAEFLKFLKEYTHLSGKQFWMPLRALLTGETKGPELAGIFALLGKERILDKIKALEKQQ